MVRPTRRASRERREWACERGEVIRQRERLRRFRDTERLLSAVVVAVVAFGGGSRESRRYI